MNKKSAGDEIYNYIWGTEVRINKIHRKNSIFIEGYYSSFKILIKLTKNEIPIESKYLNDVDESKEILINPIMFLGHHFIELSIKRYLSKLSYDYNKIHDVKKLYSILEDLWSKKTENLSEEYWIKNGWHEGFKIKGRFKSLENKVLWFDKIDKNSTNFRYPDNTINEEINLDNLETGIDDLYDFFEDLNIALNRIL